MTLATRPSRRKRYKAALKKRRARQIASEVMKWLSLSGRLRAAGLISEAAYAMGRALNG